MLPARYEEESRRRFGAGDWRQPANEYRVPVTQRQNLRPIVKDVMLEQTHWTARVKKKLGGLRKIYKRKIYVRDIKEENYVGGLLVDFSVALTEPHFMFDIKDWKWIHNQKTRDLEDFDVMVEEKGIRTIVRAAPKLGYRGKLRPRSRRTRALER